MLMNFKKLLGTFELVHDLPQTEEMSGQPPATQLMRSLRVILKHEDLENQFVFKYLASARIALDALPLGTVEYAQVAAGLENAHGYYHSGTPGAARYELRRLHHLLRNHMDDCKAVD